MSDQDPNYSQDFQQEMSTNHLSSAAHHHSSAAVPPKATTPPPQSQEFSEEDIICSSMQRLSIAAHHHSSAEVPPKATAAATTGEKRPSHFPALPSPKRASLNHAPPPSAAGDGGYTKLPLPMATQSHLARTVSEPIDYGVPTSSDTILQETSNGVRRSSSVLPSIQRTVSDPSPFVNLGTPPRPPLARTSASPSCGELSPSVKRSMRMKERMKEMSEWWNHVLSDGDDTEFENCNSEEIPKGESETEAENPSQEAVWVERNGDSLVLNFRCPCGNGYQILLSGNNCYYKLTSF